MIERGHRPPPQSGHVSPPTLHSYIEDNHRLITTLGVFTALTLFARQIPWSGFANVLSALFLSLTLLVWLELAGRFPSGMGTSRMYWFESTLGLTVVALAVYWFLSVRTVFPWITLLLTFFAMSSLISVIMKRFDLFNRLFKAQPGQRRTFRYLLGIALLIVAGAIAILAASLAAMYIDPLLGSIDTSLPQP